MEYQSGLSVVANAMYPQDIATELCRQVETCGVFERQSWRVKEPVLGMQ